MSMDVTSIKNQPDYLDAFMLQKRERSAARRSEAAAKTPPPDIEASVKNLEDISNIFNHRLKYSVNKELDRVVVKVVDAQTDKVIKELPPEDIQRLLVRIRESIGLLVDETI